MKWPEFREVIQAVIAILIITGGGLMVWYGRAAPETIYPVIGVILGFYFGSANTAAVTKAATAAATEAMSRVLAERNIGG